MLRLMNIAALTLLVGSAAWAYQTKYETIWYAEQVRKLEAKTEKERDTIAILKAEWQLLNRPTRIEALAGRHLDLKPLKPTQVSRAQDLPERGKEVDHIGAILTGSIPTPNSGRQTTGKTPASQKR